MRMMSEAIAQNTAPETTETPEVEETTTDVDESSSTPTTDDVVARIAREQTTTTVESDGQDAEASPETKFNVNDIDNIEDPQAKEYAHKAYKSLEKGYQQKFQELAAERKALEQKASEATKWTPEKVQSLLSNQEFIQASQSYMQSTNPTEGQMSDDDWSALSEAEKTQFKAMQTKIDRMEQENKLASFQAELSRQDTELASKYSDYDSAKVTQLRNDMLQGNVQATNEHLWKVLNYEDAIKRAYNLGKEDRKMEMNDKVNSSSPVTNSTRTQPSNTIVRQEGEDNKSFLARIFEARMNEQAKKT